MKKVVWLRIFRGKEILYKADGKPSNENQIVKLIYDTFEFKNYLKYLKGGGLCKVDVVKVLEQKGGKFVEIEITDEIKEEVKLAHEGINEVILTPDQEEIKKLKAQMAELLKSKEPDGENDGEDDDDDDGKRDEQTLESLKEAYVKRFGKKPHWKWNKEKIAEKIAEK